jgi:hypothetical protein
MCEFKTKTIVVKKEENVRNVIDFLIGQWFAIMPLPDDEWEVCVKEENYGRIIDFLYTWAI